MSKSQNRHATDDLKKELRSAADEMQKLAAEVRVKLHLASMDVKSSWAEFEPRLHEFKEKAERAAEGTVSGLSSLAAELTQRLREFRRTLT